MTRPTLHIAVAGQKSKASDYNDNFDIMMDYLEDSIVENKAYTQNVLSIYETINTLPTQGTVNLTNDSINAIAPNGNVTFVLPSVTDGKFHQILVQMYLADATATGYIQSLGTTKYYNAITPTFVVAGYYDLLYVYDSLMNEWVVSSIRKG